MIKSLIKNHNFVDSDVLVFFKTKAFSLLQMQVNTTIKRFCLLIFIFLYQILLLTGQNHFVFFPIDSKDGLSGNRVRSMGQLPDGRLIIVTEGLVNLYDGKNFKYLHIKDDKTYPLSEYDGHHRMYVDNSNGLWIKNKHTLVYFDIEHEEFVANLDSILKLQNIDVQLADVFVDSQKHFWYLSNDFSLYQNDLTTKENILFKKQIINKGTLKDQLYDIEVVNNQLFLFYKSGLMSCYDLISHDLLYEFNPLNNEATLDYQQTLMVVCFDKYLYQIRNGDRGNSIMLRYNVKNKKWLKILEENYRLNTLSIDNSGNCYVSTTRGFWWISHDLSQKQYIPELSLEDGRIFDTEISTQYNDKTGGLWIGSFNRGMLYYHPDRFLFRNNGTTLFEKLSTKNLMVNSFTENSIHTLIGTNNGIYKKTSNQNKLVKDNRFPSNMICNTMLTDSKMRTWIGSEQSGIFCTKNQTMHHYKMNASCNYIYEAYNGKILLFTNHGVYNYSEKNDNFILIANDNKSYNIKQVLEIKSDLLLCISDNDIFYLDIKKTPSIQLPIDSIFSDNMGKLSNHKYNCISLDSRGMIWLGTHDGLYMINRGTGKLTSFHTENGLVNNYIQSIIEDHESRIWVSTSSGISKIDLLVDKVGEYSTSITNYNHYDGVIGSGFLPRSVFLSKDKNIYWGGLDGYNQINTIQLSKDHTLLQQPILSNLYINGIKVNQGTQLKGRAILSKSLASTDEIELRYNQNFFTVEFSALNYINEFRTFYKYKLEGFDEGWHTFNSTNGIGNATYTNLSPGNYKLKILSSNSLKLWGNNYRELAIVIHPPLWKTPYFYVLYFIIGVVSIYAGLSYALKQGKRRNERKQKEALDQMKFSFFTNVSHELRTPLTLIITPLNSIIQKIDESPLKKQLINITKNANNLLDIVNQLLDFRKLEMRGEYLQLSYCNINDFINVIGQSYEEMAESKGINFTWDTMEQVDAYVDSVKLRKVINNLLSNAFKFTSEYGNISLSAKLGHIPDSETPAICITVTDNGIGIPKDELNHIFDRFYQIKKHEKSHSGSGIGLHMAREYALLHHGIIEVNSEPGEGTSFIIYIPAQLHPENTTEENEEVVDAGNLKLLVVEDNKDFREFLKAELSENYTVISSTNGLDAILKVQEFNPDIIISDYSMPEMNGYEFCKKIKNDLNTSHIPFIMLTAHTSDKDQLMSFNAGADAFITKPFNMEILLLRIEKLIEQKKQRLNLYKNTIVVQPKHVASSNMDEEFIKKALECVEKNMSNPSYSVVDFSRDMHMDRTGLFRKLKVLVGQSPSSFLKSIRLKKSAQFLNEGIAVSDAAEMVGFGGLSYFSKCFFEEFHVKPSQYIQQNKIR